MANKKQKSQTHLLIGIVIAAILIVGLILAKIQTNNVQTTVSKATEETVLTPSNDLLSLRQDLNTLQEDQFEDSSY